MAATSEFTVRDFIDLVKELNEHEAKLKTRSAKRTSSQRAGR